MISGEIQVVSAQRSGAGTAHESTRWALRQAVGRPRLRPVRGAPNWAQLLTLAVVVVLAQSCAGVPKRNPVPAIYSAIAEVPGIPRARFWGDEAPPYMKEWFAASKAHLQARYPAIMGRKHNYLALSGGGQRGAFGAGVLVGWTEAGTRPEFTLVTGVSTGALMAPFAFLGSEYDAELKDFYTKYSTKDLLKKRNFLKALTSDAAASSAPLKALIAKHVDQHVLEEIATEFRKGRLLYIGTTNLDADRPVMWNIGRIAASHVPNALALVHDIILASASIPAAFPPVMIEVEAKGQLYDELHVDGGVTSQVFLYPLGLDWRRVTEHLDAKGRPSVYLIRNAKLDPQWTAVKRRLRPIAGRSIAALIRTQGIGDMYRIYVGARRDGMDYHLAYIPDEFNEESKEPFDREYMGKLFDLGYRMAKAGYPWKNAPRALEAP
jgi:hypothetical protein